MDKYVHDRLTLAAKATPQEIFEALGTTANGLPENEVEETRNKYGDNTVTRGKKTSLPKRLVAAFINPFTAILFCLVLVSVFVDVVLAPPGEADPTAIIIIIAMVLISGFLRFIQETRSGHAAENLLKMIVTTIDVQRPDIGTVEIPLEDVVVGDIVHIAAGDMIPADMRILQAKDLFVSQAALTGESAPVEKTADAAKSNHALTEMPNLAFMGTNVISGSATGVVVATGNDTIFGDMAKSISAKPVQTSFEKGLNSISWLLIRFMLVMVPVVLFINGFARGNWIEATLFALSVAVGLTPEMLPMIVTTCLAKGAVAMSRKKTIIKNLNSIQNLGSMNILCTDKTGTLTQDKVVLQYHLNIQGQEDVKVLRHAFLNSYYQTGLKNLMDIAIIQRAEEEKTTEPELAGLTDKFTKVDEIPFDFERRRMSVVVSNNTSGDTQMITKGAVEEMLAICSFVEYDGRVEPMTEDLKAYILQKVEDLSEDGLRVIAVAQKHSPPGAGALSVADETGMTLIGYIAFLDPPKESAATAIKALNDYGVAVKILTGDNDKVTRCVCRQVGLPVERILLGSDLDSMDDAALAQAAEAVSVFAKLSPQQKARVITALRGKGHSVGYMGDGINDAAAMKASDVGIS
ncbi:MAG: magnesium-translocating P-type ATPase, partial [Defluviitaleaceae bacterium]|nr:magnesium-translocating P-type ATPase [Defluviitaleaceae bacterium]